MYIQGRIEGGAKGRSPPPEHLRGGRGTPLRFSKIEVISLPKRNSHKKCKELYIFNIQSSMPKHNKDSLYTIIKKSPH